MEVTSVVMVRSEALGFLAYKKRRIFGCSGTVYTHEKGKSRHTMIQDIAPHTWDITYKNIQPDPDSRGLFLAGDSFLCSRHRTSLLTNPIRIFIR